MQPFTPDRFVSARGGAANPRFKSLARFRSLAEYRAATPLPKNTQEVIDNAVIRIGRDRLAVVDDLLSLGLTVPMPGWLGIPSLTSHKVGEAGHAQVSMVPRSQRTRGERQVAQLTPYTIPIPCVWDDFSFDIRELSAAERVDYPLDTSHVEQATRNVNVAIEDMAWNGGPQINNHTLPGILSSTNTQTFVGGEAWDVAGHTGEEILQDVQAMIGVLQADKFYGPYRLYITGSYDRKLNEDYKSATSGTIRERLSALGALNGIRVADYLPANTVVLLQTTRDVIDVIVGQQPTPITWEDGPGFERDWVVMACIVPRVKNNSDGNYGICVGTPS
jgi:uncharacterized linocin/CFP29 family protein